MKINKIFTVFFLVSLIGVEGCDNAKYEVIDNGVYISEAAKSNINKITVDDKGGLSTITVRTASFCDNDVHIDLGKATANELAEFNQHNGTAYKILPDTCFSLSANKVVIPKGNISAPTVEVKVKPLGNELIESGDKYVLPVTIESADENIHKPAKTMFYTIDQVIITSAPYLKGRSINVALDKKITTLPWTLEYRIWVKELYASNYAQGVSFWGAGPATEIYFRWGDANVPGNLIMTKTQGGQFISTKPAKGGQWYHHAWVHDGKTVKLYINGEFDTQMDSPGKISELEEKFGLYSGQTAFMWSEWRFWSVARTQKQIKENMFSVNPATEGLEIYFKFNEGKGKTFKDYAGKHNITAVADGDIEWKAGIRSDEQ